MPESDTKELLFLIPTNHTISKETCFWNLVFVPNPGQELKYSQNLGKEGLSEKHT